MKMKKVFCCAIAVLTLFCACANGNESFEDQYTIVGEESVVHPAAMVGTYESETEPPESLIEPESIVTETESETETETEPVSHTPETLPVIVTPATPAVVDVPIETVVETEPPETETEIVETEPPETEPIVVETKPVVIETEPVIMETTPPETTAPETTLVETLPPETEPKTIAAEEPTEITYVLNKNTKKFHKPTCASVKKIKAENYEAFTGTREEAIANGYDPCKNCKP